MSNIKSPEPVIFDLKQKPFETKSLEAFKKAKEDRDPEQNGQPKKAKITPNVVHHSLFDLEPQEIQRKFYIVKFFQKISVYMMDTEEAAKKMVEYFSKPLSKGTDGAYYIVEAPEGAREEDMHAVHIWILDHGKNHVWVKCPKEFIHIVSKE